MALLVITLICYKDEVSESGNREWFDQEARLEFVNPAGFAESG